MPNEHTMTTRERYVERFGEEQAAALEQAAQEHRRQRMGVGTDRGSDPFKWACLVAVGFQCAELDRFREYHGITAPWADIKAFFMEADLGSFDGGMPDVLAALAGAYGEYIKQPEL